MELPDALFKPKLEQIKNINPPKFPYILELWIFLALILKHFLYFFKKAFRIIQERETLKKVPYVSGNETFLYFKKLKH